MKKKPHHWLTALVVISFVILVFKPKIAIDLISPGFYNEGKMPIQSLFMGFVVLTCWLYRKYQFNPMLNVIHVFFTAIAFGYFLIQENLIINGIGEEASLDELFANTLQFRFLGILLAIISQIPFLLNVIITIFKNGKEDRIDDIIDVDI